MLSLYLYNQMPRLVALQYTIYMTLEGGLSNGEYTLSCSKVANLMTSYEVLRIAAFVC